LLTGGDHKQAHLWNLTTGAKERDFPGADLPVTSVAFSGDGKTIALGSTDKSVALWTAGDGKQQRKLILPAAVQAVALSPDGRFVAAGLADGVIRIQETAAPKDPPKGKEKEKEKEITLAGHKGGVSSLTYSPKGDLLISAGADGVVQVSAMPSGEAKTKLEVGGPVAALALSKDGARLAAAAGKAVKVWNLGDGKELATVTAPADVRSVGFAPDGNRLVVGSDNRARVYGLDGRQAEFFSQDGAVRAVAFHPDGKRIVSAGEDKTARVWTSALLWQRVVGGPVRQALFTPKGDQVIAAGDKTVRVWNAADTKEVKTFDAHDGPVVDLGISADGQRLVTAGADKTVKVWSLPPVKAGTKDDGKPQATFPLTGAAQSVAISPNGQRVAVSAGDAKDSTVRVFDIGLGREILVIPGHNGPVHDLSFLGDNRTLVSAGADKTARLEDVGILTVLDAHKGGVVGVQYHSNGTQALTAGKDNTVKLWDLTKGAVLKEFGKLTEPVAAVTFNRDYTQVGVAAGKTVRVFNAADGKEVLALAHPADVLSLSFSVDKARIATGATDNQTRLWDVATQKELQFFAHAGPARAVLLHPNNKDLVSAAGKDVTADAASVARVVPVSAGPVHALTLTPNATHVLTAGADKLVTFWNLANGNKDRTVAGAGGALRAVAVSKNLALLATGGEDKTVRLYNFADGKEVKTVEAPAPVRALTFSPNNVALAAACADRSLAVWATPYTPGQPLSPDFLKPMQSFAHGEGATDVAFAADNATLWSSGTDKSIQAWKVAADAPVKNFPHPNQVYCVAFHPKAAVLASGNADGKVRFFDLVKGAQLREINAHPKPNETMIYGIGFSPDGKQLATAGYDNVVKLWNADTGALLREFKTVPFRVAPQVAARTAGLMRSPNKDGPLVSTWTLLASVDKKAFDKGHEDSVFSVAFAPDGKQLASGSGGLERVIKMWDVADATLLRDLANPKLKRAGSALPQSHPGWVYGLRYTPDGKRLVSAGDAPLNKGYLAVWDVETGKLQHGEELPLGVFFALALSPDGQRIAVGAGPRGRPTPEFNSAYLIEMPKAAK
jgi:WD40 repeat protein